MPKNRYNTIEFVIKGLKANVDGTSVELEEFSVRTSIDIQYASQLLQVWAPMLTKITETI